ncbi:MAG: FlgD immunoglobulin-like domain containing protein [Gaiellaceae bacterium]
MPYGDAERNRRMTSGHRRMTIRALLATLAVSLTVAGGAAADPVIVTTLLGSCDSSQESLAIPTIGGSHSNTMVRVSGTSASGFLDIGRHFLGGFAIDAGVVKWHRLGSVADGFNAFATFSCPLPTAFRLDLASVPPTPTSYSGVASPNDEPSEIVFIASSEARYVATLTLTQGAITLNGGSVASSGRFDLGFLSRGYHTITLGAKDGPYAVWTLSIAAVPVAIENTVFFVPLSRPGVVVDAHYSTTGAGVVRAVILNPGGQVVRVLAEKLNVGRGGHALSWDGLSGNGAPVPDGHYRLRLELTDATGGSTTGDAQITIDGRPPTVLVPRFLTPRRGLVIVARDATSGVRATTVRAGGKTVRGISGVVLLPRNGWKRGYSYPVQIVSVDKAGNRVVVAKVLKVR